GAGLCRRVPAGVAARAGVARPVRRARPDAADQLPDALAGQRRGVLRCRVGMDRAAAVAAGLPVRHRAVRPAGAGVALVAGAACAGAGRGAVAPADIPGGKRISPVARLRSRRRSCAFPSSPRTHAEPRRGPDVERQSIGETLVRLALLRRLCPRFAYLNALKSMSFLRALYSAVDSAFLHSCGFRISHTEPKPGTDLPASRCRKTSALPEPALRKPGGPATLRVSQATGPLLLV